MAAAVGWRDTIGPPRHVLFVLMDRMATEEVVLSLPTRDLFSPIEWTVLFPSASPPSPLRFGDTAANVGVLALLEAFESTKSLPLPVKSAAGSIAAGAWRIALTPIDAYKTTLQVCVRGRGSYTQVCSNIRLLTGVRCRTVCG